MPLPRLSMVALVPLLFLLCCQGILTAMAATLTPQRLISAPRSSGDFQLSPSSDRFIVPVTHKNLEAQDSDKLSSSSVHVFELPSESKLQQAANDSAHPEAVSILEGVEYATWIDDSHLIYSKDSKLFVVHASSSSGSAKAQEIGKLPAPISESSLKIVPSTDKSIKRLVFAAEVYEDGELEGVSKVETPEHEEEWKRVKAYDSKIGFFRHWDQWSRNGKRSQLFTTVLKHSSDGWSLKDGKFTNLVKGSLVNTPIPTFGGNGDWDVHEKGVIFITKALDRPEAWHTKTDVYYVSYSGDKGLEKISSGDHGAISEPRWSPDGKTIAWLEMARDGFESDKRVIQTFAFGSGEQTAWAKSWDRSPSGISFSPDGKVLDLAVEDLQQEKHFVLDLQAVSPSAESPRLLSAKDFKGSVNQVRSLDEKSDYVLFSASTLRSVSEVYLYSRKSSTAYPLTWFTGSKSSTLKDISWGPEPEPFRYQAPDYADEERWGWIFYPPGFSSPSLKDKKWPLLVLIHGGPEGAWTDSWSTRWNPEVFAAANDGYMVITLNPTGSTGFGHEYMSRIINDWGGQPYRDIISGVQHILRTHASSIDASNIAGLGASYGGFMANWLQGHNEDGLFKTLVNHDGIFNTFNTFYATDELYFPHSEMNSGPPWSLESRSFYTKWSPEGHVSKWNTPMLIIHGAKDWRLTPTEGISAFNVLRYKGVDSRLVYFEDEGHWVQNPKNSLRWHNEIFQWLDKYLGGGGGSDGDGDGAKEEGQKREKEKVVKAQQGNKEAAGLIFQ